MTAAPSGDRPPPAPQSLHLTTEDGVALRARWRRRPAARATAVIVHGFSGGKDNSQVSQLADDLSAAGLDVLTYDARGHGASGGTCGVGSTEHLDVAAAARWAANGNLPVVLIGVSMGAIAVVRHLARLEVAGARDPADRPRPDRLAGAVLVSAPSRWRMRLSPTGLGMALITRTAPGRWSAARWLGVRIGRGWRPGEAPEVALRTVRLPVALVHGEADRLLSPEHARRLERASGGPRLLEVVPGMGHGLDEPGRRAVCQAVSALLESRTDDALAGADAG